VMAYGIEPPEVPAKVIVYVPELWLAGRLTSTSPNGLLGKLNSPQVTGWVSPASGYVGAGKRDAAVR